MNTVLTTLNSVIKERDEKLIEKYCQKGEYLGSAEKPTIHGVCKAVDFEEILNTMHNNDVVFIETVKARIQLEKNKHNDPKVTTALNNLLMYLGQ